jgi:ferredoxin
MGVPVSVTLRINPIACVGHGMCAELLPEIIRLDPWGYPILSSATVPRALEDHARRAVQACPTLALLIEEAAGKHR